MKYFCLVDGGDDDFLPALVEFRSLIGALPNRLVVSEQELLAVIPRLSEWVGFAEFGSKEAVEQSNLNLFLVCIPESLAKDIIRHHDNQLGFKNLEAQRKSLEDALKKFDFEHRSRWKLSSDLCKEAVSKLREHGNNIAALAGIGGK
jgi:hypothetical protein